MKLYHSLVPLLVIAQDDDPLADWEIRDLSLQCGFDTPTELTFEIYPGDIDIDTSTFHARDCSYGDLTEVISEAVTENLPADQQDKGRTKYTVKYNPNTCMGTVADPTNLGTYASNVTFNFDFGYEHQSVFMHMRTYRIPAICSFKSQYNLKFDFGKIQQGIVETNGTDLQPINGGIVFDFNVYKDSALTEPVYNTNSGLKTGQMVYFTIVPQFNFPSGLQYAPPVCQFLQETCDEDDNCNVHQEFSLFNHEVDECQQPPNSPLQFDISYIQSTDEWRSQFRLFLFGEDIDQSTYTLRCEVDVCVDTCASDVVVPNQQCGNIAQKCLSEDEYIQYNDQCLFCGSGQEANDANDACVPITQFSGSVMSKVFIYPQSVDEIWVFDFDQESETFSLDKKIEGWADAPISGSYDWGNGYVVFNQDTGLVNWFSTGGGHYRQKVLRYTLETGAFHSMGDLATNFHNADTVVWTAQYGVLIMKSNSGSIENPSPNTGMDPKTDLPNIPQPGFYDAQAVYADGKVYIAPGNTGYFQYLDLTSEEWTVLDTPFSQGLDGYFQMVKWGNKWVYIRNQQIVVFQVSDDETSLTYTEFSVTTSRWEFTSFHFMKGNVLYSWVRGATQSCGEKITFNDAGTEIIDTQSCWSTQSMRDAGFTIDRNYWSHVI